VIRKAVIPAAGLGTRFLPATKSQPKEMLPVVDTPAIHYVVKEAIEAGIDDILIITGKDKTAIENYFDRSVELEYLLEGKEGKEDLLHLVQDIAHLANIHYIRQKEPLGLGHAVLQAKQHVGNEPFCVLLGDDIFQAEVPVLKQMIVEYERYGDPVIALERIDPSQTDKYGIVDIHTTMSSRTYKLKDLVEKPPVSQAPSNLAIIGRYILTADIFEILENTKPGRGGEIQLTDGLRRLREQRDIFGYEPEGIRHDIGDKQGFLRATVEFALERTDIGPAFAEYLKDLVKRGI